jgi:hypothetical protein
LRGSVIDKINIGAGKFRKDGWTNIDHSSTHYIKNGIDIDIDLLGNYSFPVKDNMIRMAYSSHVVEHLSEDAVKKMISETFRVLAPNGFFRITCPDAREALDALICGNDEFFSIYDSSVCFNNQESMKRYYLTTPLSMASIYQKFLYFIAPQRCIHVNVPCEKITDDKLQSMIKNHYSQCDILNYVTSEINEEVRSNNPWMHITWWTIEKLKAALYDAGFRIIYQSFPGLSECKEMRNLNHFDWALPKLSLYIEAVK